MHGKGKNLWEKAFNYVYSNYGCDAMHPLAKNVRNKDWIVLVKNQDTMLLLKTQLMFLMAQSPMNLR